jgi:hypothetical protein
MGDGPHKALVNGWRSGNYTLAWAEDSGSTSSTPKLDGPMRAVAFSHSAQLALLANFGFVALALILVLALPRTIPDRR